MSGAKFTKGDWTPCMYNNDDIQVTFFGVVIGGCYHNLGSGIEYQANAHLIAVAPEMYEELQEVSNWLNRQLGMGEWHKDIEKLLAKARGEI